MYRASIGVLTVIEDLGTPTPLMVPAAKAILKQIQDPLPDAEFDQANMKAQLANHEFLRDLANTYLANSITHQSMAEKHGRHLTTLTLSIFKEHVVYCKDFLKLT